MIRAVIVDDEKPSINILQRLLTNSGKVDVVGCFNKPEGALYFLQNNSVDVAFLDIEMPEINGFELAASINAKYTLDKRCAIVFVTAYNKYAVEAFHINALDYLVKPVSKIRLKDTLERIIEELRINVLPTETKVQCFGAFKITAGSTKVKFRTKKSEELLAYLIEKRGKNILRNVIVDCLWNDFDGDKALINFNTTLYYLRKVLVKHGLGLSIIYEDGSYRLETQGIKCDYFSFMDCEFSEGNINCDNISYYEEIASLYTGEFLQSSEYSWAESSRLNCKEKYIRLILSMADYYIMANQTSQAIEIMKSGFSFEPYNGKITYNLMKLLLGEDNNSLAAEYYKLHQSALIDSYGIEPDEALKQLLENTRP